MGFGIFLFLGPYGVNYDEKSPFFPKKPQKWLFFVFFRPPGASFGLILGLHQDFMSLQGPKYGFRDVFIFKPVRAC